MDLIEILFDVNNYLAMVQEEDNVDTDRIEIARLHELIKTVTADENRPHYPVTVDDVPVDGAYMVRDALAHYTALDSIMKAQLGMDPLTKLDRQIDAGIVIGMLMGMEIAQAIPTEEDDE